MSQEIPLRELSRRMKTGDTAAAQIFVSQYEQKIRRMIRNRMHDPRLDRHFDSGDVFQSAVIALLKGDIDEPSVFHGKENSLAVFYTVARNKLHDRIRRLKADKRNMNLEAGGLADEVEVGNDADEISQILRINRVVDQILNAPVEIQAICEMRCDGKSWEEIGGTLGIKPDTARKRLDRWIEKVKPNLEE